MPHTSTPPTSIDQVIRIGFADPEFAATYEENPKDTYPPYLVSRSRADAEALLPTIRESLARSKPCEIVESEHLVALRDGHECRAIICYKSKLIKANNDTAAKGTDSQHKSPIILLFHGGGHCTGYPEDELELARELALNHSAVVVCPSYRLAPEYPFPYGILDSWDILSWIAEESHKVVSDVFPSSTDPYAGFIIGGTSAGANLAASLTHLARDRKLNPPLTGQFLSAGTFLAPEHVPLKYKPLYLSWAHSAKSPILNRDMCDMFRGALNPDPLSPLWASFNQHPSSPDRPISQGHMNLPPAYFQICGADPCRDDSLIYERVLRQECRIQTKMDLYSGFPHCWWAVYPELEMSKKRMRDSLAAIGWLLEVETNGRNA